MKYVEAPMAVAPAPLNFSYLPAFCELSDDEKFRYSLARRFRLATDWRRLALFVMLNPSTADALKDDATIRRLKGFTRGWHLDGFDVVNLFALRATNPKELIAHDSPYSDHMQGWQQDEDKALGAAFCRNYGLIVFAWGNGPGGIPFGRDERAIHLCQSALNGWHRPMCFGYTQSGQPLHPLRLPKKAQLRLFRYGGPA